MLTRKKSSAFLLSPSLFYWIAQETRHLFHFLPSFLSLVKFRFILSINSFILRRAIFSLCFWRPLLEPPAGLHGCREHSMKVLAPQIFREARISSGKDVKTCSSTQKAGNWKRLIAWWSVLSVGPGHTKLYNQDQRWLTAQMTSTLYAWLKPGQVLSLGLKLSLEANFLKEMTCTSSWVLM